MPCDHKFLNDLDLAHIDFEPTTLIVGTFHPSWPDNDAAGWFYGRTTKNYFWDVLPRLYGEASLINAGANEWKRFCKEKHIAFTDTISSIEDAEPVDPAHNEMLKNLSDKAIEFNFYDHAYVNIVQILKDNPGIKNVYLTRGATEAFWRHLWNPVAHYCHTNNIHERKLLTPTGDASYQFETYNNQYPENKIAQLEDYILMRWQQEWHF